MWLSLASCSACADWRASICSSWVKPSTALSGVRSSWLMRERNCDLAWISRSASAVCWRVSSASFASVTSQLTPTRRIGLPLSSLTRAEREASQRQLPSGIFQRNSYEVGSVPTAAFGSESSTCGRSSGCTPAIRSSRDSAAARGARPRRWNICSSQRSGVPSRRASHMPMPA